LFFTFGLVPARATLRAQEAPDAALARLLAVYRTRPDGYPTGREYARPDTDAPFRWHSFSADAITAPADARMVLEAASYNPLEGEGVSADAPSGVKFAFVTEHVTQGKQALRVDFPAQAIKDGKAVVRIQAVAGPPAMPSKTVCLASNYRWVKLDVSNPTGDPVRITVGSVPLVLHPGANVVAVKTVDASGYIVPVHWPDTSGAHQPNPANFSYLPLAVTAPARDISLFVDHVRLEQEVPDTLRRKGRLFHFAARETAQGAPLVWPGFTYVPSDTTYTAERKFGWTAPARTRTHAGLSFRSFENGIIWGRCVGIDTPFRVDLPNGRYGLSIFATPVSGFNWAKGGLLKVNGKEQVLIDPRTPAEVRQAALGGETWDYRPGACVWESLVRPAYFPPTNVLFSEVTDGHLLLEFPGSVALRTIVIFPEEDKAAALQELARLNFLLAESWDVAHPWVKGDYATRAHYIGYHDEAARPETIPGRLRALRLSAADFRRGFLLFQRELTEAIYPDTIPTAEEAQARPLRCFAVPGQRERLTLGLLPLAPVSGLQIKVTDLTAARDGTGRVPSGQIDVRLARYQQKTMEFGHHNHAYNYQEHYLLRRPQFDLHPGAARRVYLEIAVPAGTRPGEYAGELTVVAQGQTLATVPIQVEVLAFELQEPPVFWATEGSNPLLKHYGINTSSGDYDEAVQHGFKGHVVMPYSRQNRVQGKDLGGWGNLLQHKDLLQKLAAEARQGKGPRSFFRGSPEGNVIFGNPKAPFFVKLVEEAPRLDVLNVTVPVYVSTVWPWGGASKGTPELLQAARASGKEFWFCDWVRYSKEQSARFTCGCWLWRLGAAGRFSSFSAGSDYHYGTAREASPWVPYYTLLGVVGGNLCESLKESSVPGDWNPSRDLVLIAAGVDDYRYLHTLECWIARAEAGKRDGPALAAAKKFRDETRAALVLDLGQYYQMRNGSYAENWYPAPGNPWRGDKFDQVRREAARHILSVKQAVGD
jgi:hypothetical protein